MKTLTFLNDKGGVGKTASVTAVAHILNVVHKKKVLVCDVDPQGNTSNLFGNIDFSELFRARYEDTINVPKHSMGDLLLNTELDPKGVIQKTAYEGLDIIPSFPTLSVVEEQLKADVKTPQQFRIKTQLDKIRDQYDYCIIDCSPSLSILNVNALVASDEVYMPTLVDDGSLYGIELSKTELVDQVKKYTPHLKMGGIFFTRFKGYTNVSKFARQLLNKAYGDEVLPITIRDSIVVSESSHNHMPLLAYDNKKNKCNATLDYLLLTEYIAAENRIEVLKEIKEGKKVS